MSLLQILQFFVLLLEQNRLWVVAWLFHACDAVDVATSKVSLPLDHLSDLQSDICEPRLKMILHFNLLF